MRRVSLTLVALFLVALTAPPAMALERESTILSVTYGGGGTHSQHTTVDRVSFDPSTHVISVTVTPHCWDWYYQLDEDTVIGPYPSFPNHVEGTVRQPGVTASSAVGFAGCEVPVVLVFGPSDVVTLSSVPLHAGRATFDLLSTQDVFSATGVESVMVVEIRL